MLRFTWILFALAIGCGTKDPAVDAHVVPGDPLVEMGVGLETFEYFEDGDTLGLVCGNQGAQHVWTAIRGHNVDPAGTILDLSFVRDRDQMMVSQLFRVRVTLQPVAGQPYTQISGLTLIVPEPDQAIGEALTMRGIITTRDMHEFRIERPVQIEWVPGSCDF
jgi:hypothetical protein